MKTTSSIFPDPKNDLTGNYLWQIWVLRTTGRKTTVRLFYSWVVPDVSGRLGWDRPIKEYAENVIDREGNTVKLELLRADHRGVGTVIQGYVQGLATGKLLNEIEAGPDYPPKEFLNLKLGENEGAVKQAYKVRPEVLLPVEHLLIPWTHKSIPSPTDFSAFVSQLVCLDKLPLLLLENVNLYPIIQASTLKNLAKALRKSTGFNLTRESAPRAGNIEWYRFPAASDMLDSLVSFRCRKTSIPPGIEVEVRLAALPISKAARQVLVRCRLVNGEEVAMDDIKEVSWQQQDLNLIFVSCQPISEATVTIWEKDTANGQCAIIYENQKTFMRSITLRPSLIGTIINSGKINLLNKLVSKDEKGKPGELAKYSRSTQAGSSEVGSYKEDPWVTAGRTAVDMVQQLFPDVSGAKFFLNGWDETAGASGQLSFVQWIFKVISGEEQGGLILLDPYFDKDGIEIFANARTTNTSFRILTCTQHREKVAGPPEPEAAQATVTPAIEQDLTQPAANIRDYCRQMLPLLQSLDMKILDLKSQQGGSSPLFHDRYLLLTDQQGRVIQGFHLSNSIQGATRKAPLLITLIPADILPAVYAYVENLIDSGKQGTGSKKTEIITIFSSRQEGKEKPNRISGPEAQTEKLGKLGGIPDPGFLFANLLNDPSLENLNPVDLKTAIEKRQIIDKAGSFLPIIFPAAQIKAFVQRLALLEGADFNRLVSALGELRARSHWYDFSGPLIDDKGNPLKKYNAWEELKRPAGLYSTIGVKLAAYLKTFTTSNKLISYRDRLYSILQCPSFEEGFETAFSAIRNIYGEGSSLPYGLSYGCEILAEQFPDRAVQLVEELTGEAQKENWNEADDQIRARMLLLTGILRNLLDYGPQRSPEIQAWLLKSGDQCIRAAGSAILIISVLSTSEPGLPVSEIVTTLRGELQDTEYRLALAAGIAELQIKTKDAGQQALENSLFKNLLDNWVGDEAVIGRVAKTLSGRLEVNHSLLITDKFLLPLVEQGIITAVRAFSYWQEPFLEKVKYRTEYKDNGSADTPYNFTLGTDVELTKTLIRLASMLSEQEQQKAIQQWFEAINLAWNIVNQPFSRHANYHSYYHSASRIYWVSFILKGLKDSNALTGTSMTLADNFIQGHQYELQRVNAFINQLDNGINELK